MARKRTNRLDLPERVYYHHGAYYFVHPSGKWEKLDRDYTKAMAAWARLLVTPGTNATTVGELLDRYILEVIPTKAARTQKDNLKEIRFLRAFFGAMDIKDVQPAHIAQYRDQREAKTRGNRELALLSHAFSRAAEWNLCSTNPCREVRRNKEKARDRYITDEELSAFKAVCPDWLKSYVDLKEMTGMRQQDLLALTRKQISDEFLTVKPMKTQATTGKVIRIVLTPELRAVLDTLPGDILFSTRDGKHYTSAGFASIWQRVMKKYEAAGNERFHEHDIRGKVATDLEDAQAAKSLLGHNEMSTTESYIKQRKIDKVQPNRKRSK